MEYWKDRVNSRFPEIVVLIKRNFYLYQYVLDTFDLKPHSRYILENTCYVS